MPGTPDDLLTVEDIILRASNGTKIRQRSPRTVIDSPNGGEPTITFLQQAVVEINKEPVSAYDLPSIILPFSSEALVFHELTDPVTGQVHRTSGAFIGQWLRAHYVFRVKNPLPPPAV